MNSVCQQVANWNDSHFLLFHFFGHLPGGLIRCDLKCGISVKRQHLESSHLALNTSSAPSQSCAFRKVTTSKCQLPHLWNKACNKPYLMGLYRWLNEMHESYLLRFCHSQWSVFLCWKGWWCLQGEGGTYSYCPLTSPNQSTHHPQHQGLHHSCLVPTKNVS